MSAPDPRMLISSLIAEDAQFADIVREFVDGLDTRIEEFRSAYEHLDWQSLTTLAHRLKGAGGSYGYPDLSTLAREMEEEFRRHVATNFQTRIEQLTQLIAAARAGLPEDNSASEST